MKKTDATNARSVSQKKKKLMQEVRSRHEFGGVTQRWIGKEIFCKRGDREPDQWSHHQIYKHTLMLTCRPYHTRVSYYKCSFINTGPSSNEYWMLSFVVW